jgi:hypothetical protein
MSAEQLRDLIEITGSRDAASESQREFLAILVRGGL